MIRFGVVNIDTSHPLAFSKLVRQGERARISHVYNDSFRGDDEVEAFIRNHELEGRCATIEELADRVDVGFVNDCDWDVHVEHVRPFVERGKPVFVDKPFVGKLRDCRAMEEMAAHGAHIYGSSSLRYAFEIRDFLAQPIEERGEVVSVFGTSGMNEFDYACHIVEAFGGLLGPGAESVKFCGAGEAGGARVETFHIKWATGQSAVYSACHGVGQPFDMVITTTKGITHFRIDTGQIYGALLDRICDAVEDGEQEIVPVTELTESVKVLLASRLSRERCGAEVALDDVPEDDPGFDGAAFRKAYAAKTTKMYL